MPLHLRVFGGKKMEVEKREAGKLKSTFVAWYQPKTPLVRRWTTRRMATSLVQQEGRAPNDDVVGPARDNHVLGVVPRMVALYDNVLVVAPNNGVLGTALEDYVLDNLQGVLFYGALWISTSLEQ